MIGADAGRNLPHFGLARTFVGIFTALLLFLVAILALHYYADFRAHRAQIESGETLNVELARRAVTADLASVLTDLGFLARHVEGLDFSAGTASARLSYLTQLFLTFSREKGLYDQIRFIDAGGRESVRVNYNDGLPVSVPDADLQDKSSRYYFGEAIMLAPGSVYVSPLDLNVEDGRIEEPYKPVMRFAAPVDDASGERRGLLVLNYLGARLISSFRRAAANIDNHVQLLNADGYWLSSVDPRLEWGFMFGNDATFGRLFPDAWRRMESFDAGQFVTDRGLFTFVNAPLSQAAGETLGSTSVRLPGDVAWKVVAHLPATAPSPMLFFKRHSLLYLSLFGVFALVAFMLASATVHRRTAETQRGYERRFRQTLEDANLAALTVDPHGRVTFCNQYLLELIDERREDVEGSDWVDQFVPEEERDEARRVLERLALPEEFPERFEGEIQTRRGERRLISWNNTLARDERGHVLGVTGIGEDITEQRRTEEQVRKLSRAVEQSPSIVIITDRAGRIEYVNPKFTEVTGYRLDEVKGRNPRVLKSGEKSPEDYRDLWETILSGGEWRGEFHNRRKNGELYWEAASISALRDENNEISHFLAVKEDITERKRLEQEIRQRDNELARARTLAELGRIAAEIAHDLRNPLSSVKMSLQILSKQADDADDAELGRIGIDQVRYMEAILNDMLEYARPGEPNIDWLNAEKLLNGTLGTLQRPIEEYGADVSVHCDAGLPSFPGDARKLRQLLANLMLNALQAVETRPAGERVVSVRANIAFAETGTAVRLQVCDNGDGIAEDIRERLFDPFFTTRTTGTGLGLSIVKQIADQHGARIGLEPNLPRGTCASVFLPVVPVGQGSGESTGADVMTDGGPAL